MASYIHEKVFMLLFSWKGMFSPVERMCEIVYVCSYKSCWVCVWRVEWKAYQAQCECVCGCLFLAFA